MTVSVRPAVPSLTYSEPLMGVSRPTGSISDVTTVKVPAATVATAGQPPDPGAGGDGDGGEGDEGADGSSGFAMASAKPGGREGNKREVFMLL
ncbi:hypothetical protein GCM10010400_31100 [Streptomyces aculeolatus]